MSPPSYAATVAEKQRSVSRKTLGALFVVLSGGLFGCNDQQPPTAPSGPTLSAPTASPLFTVSDDQLNYNDTWVSAIQVVAETTVVQTPEPVEDPTTGAMTSQLVLAEPPTEVPVLAGYGYDGSLRVTSGFTGSAESGIATVRQVDNSTSDIDNSGRLSSVVLPQEPAAELGYLQDAQIDVNGSSGGYSCKNDGSCVHMQSRTSSETTDPTGLARSSSSAVLVAKSRLRVSESWVPVRGEPGVGSKEFRQDREYEKRGTEWVLSGVRNHVVLKIDRTETRHTATIRFKDLRSHRNPAEDAKRAVRRNARERAGNPPAPAEVSIRKTEDCPYQQYRGSAYQQSRPNFLCSGGGGGGGSTEPEYPYEPRIDQSQLIDYGITHTLGTGDNTLVLAHGFFSSAHTWGRMASWLAADVGVKDIVRRTVPWYETYENQAAALHFQLRTQNYIPGPVILVGHSNGGMVSRYLARHPAAYNEANSQYGYEPLNVRGAVTIGTPHKGSPLAIFGRMTTLGNIMGIGDWTSRLVCSWAHMAGCQSFGALASSPVSRYVKSYRGPIPVLSQMQPNSSYHTSFNAQPEPFQRYGVQSYVNTKNWLLWGLNGDMTCYPWENCGGAAEVKKVDRIYKRDISCAVVGVFVLRWLGAAKCAYDAAYLKGADVLTKRQLGVSAEPTDGVVPRSSQLYPNIPMQDQFEIYGGPWHTAETTSDKVRNRLEEVLFNRFQLPRRR